jgi:transcriptional regulator with XRE-family HTH domain
MNDLFQNLKSEFQNEEYRYAYAGSFLNTKLAAQIKTLREQRRMTQAEVAARMGIKQPGYRRFEDSNHSVWKTDSLWSIARALGVRVNISFETFGTLTDEKLRLNKESLRRPEFNDDPAFKEPTVEETEPVADLASLQRLATEGRRQMYPVVKELNILQQLAVAGSALATIETATIRRQTPPQLSKLSLQDLAGVGGGLVNAGIRLSTTPVVPSASPIGRPYLVEKKNGTTKFKRSSRQGKRAA